LRADADERVIGEVLDILLDNAVRHGSGAVRVTVRRPEGAIAIDVADEGPGFDGADPFVRRDPAAGGHGIGLALARSLAHAEGGRVAVASPGPAPVVTLFLRPAGPSRT
jgi:signal transduction histidine kinase